jgi:hypothetical protein
VEGGGGGGLVGAEGDVRLLMSSRWANSCLGYYEKLTIFSSTCRLYEETMEDDGCRIAEGSGLIKASAH